MQTDIKTVCDSRFCTGCKACENVCPKNAVELTDSLDSYSAIIDPVKCINCGLCEKTCPVISKRELLEPVLWKQGWADDNIRSQSSSGGAASSLIISFIKNGGYVASCLYDKGDFVFEITNDLERAKKFAGSKYVKSNPGKIYNTVKEYLNRGEKVLFIGLPCQSAAVQNVCKNIKNLYTADLICHGTPSVKVLRKYLSDKGIELDAVKDMKFRDNNSFGLIVDGKKLSYKIVPDSYIWAFLKCADYSENCYNCQFASRKRVSDITLGDAWGQLSDKDDKGVSLILGQTEKGMRLINDAGMYLTDVDLEAAVSSNPQLQHPTIKPKERDELVSGLKLGRSMDSCVKSAFPWPSFKRCIKKLLIKLHVINDN